MRHLSVIAPLLLVTPLVLVAGPIVAPLSQPAPALPQAPRDPRQAEPDPKGTGSISGSVSVADSGTPARKARVSLSGAELRGRSVITDELGRFAFTALPAGRYSLSASKPGFVNVSYGQRRPGPGRPGTPIQLGDGQNLQVQLQLPRGGVITGTVLDEHGEAIPGTPVRVLRFATQSGQRTLQQAGTGSTDDRGIYRIYGLQPGDYIVAATPRNVNVSSSQVEVLRAEVAAAVAKARTDALAAADAAAARVLAERMAAARPMLPAADDEEVSGYAPVYYPGTTTAANAGTVTVGIGEEKMGIDFSLQLVPIARVEGVVVTSSGQAAQNIQVSLVNASEQVPGIGAGSARPDADGRFRISNVAPGQYLLVARGTIGGAARGARGLARGQIGAQVLERTANVSEPTRLWAMTPVSVDGRNVSNLVLTLQPGLTISGRVVFEGATPMPTDLSRVRVSASPSSQSGAPREIATTVPGRVDASGRFTISGVAPGKYRVTASSPGQGWTLASSVISGQDTLDFPAEVRPDQGLSGAVLTFTDHQSELTGTLVDEKGQPAPDYTIVVYPADRTFWTPGSRRIASQRPGTDGRFTFRNLPPGEYRIAPVLDPEPGSWYDPAFLQQLDNTALRVPLGIGEQKVQNLRIAG
jgi:protocatechuate 3,4-dioxygenase beta subunit